jgi:large subunit ribosomal protein L11
MPDVSVLIEGGKATASAPLGPALGPLGVNIGEIVNQINEKTKSFAGTKVPVKIVVNSDKSFEIKVGSPPMSAIIKKELNIKSGAANPKEDIAGNLSIEQVKNLAEMKMENLVSYKLKSAAKEVIGTCQSMGITIDGKKAFDVQKEFKEGKYDSFFGDDSISAPKQEKKEAPAEEKTDSPAGENQEEKAEEKNSAPAEEPVKQVDEVEEMKEQVADSELKKKDEEKKEQVADSEVKKKDEEMKEKAQEPEQEEGKESYSQHMKKVEKEIGAEKQPVPEKNVETVTEKDANTEITKPKEEKQE